MMRVHLLAFTAKSMTYPIGACVVATDALALFLLWIALRVSMPRLARPFVASAGLSAAWGAWVLVVVLHGPASMIALTLCAFAIASVATAISIHLATRDEEKRDGGDMGGGTDSVPQAPQGGGGNTEPPWWPEFERQVADYAAERERRRQPVKC